MDISWAILVRRAASPAVGAAVIEKVGPGRYTAPRPGPFSLIAALTITGSLIATIAAMVPTGSPVRAVERQLVVLDLTPPAPPPPRQPVTPSKPRLIARSASALSPAVAIPSVSSRPLPVAEPATDPAPASTVTPAATSRPAPPVPAPPAPPAIAAVDDLSATMISARPPKYPMLSRRNREQGTVVLRVRLALDGKVDAVSVERSSGVDRLDKAALTAVRGWRWSPTLREGRPVLVSGLVRIPFVLRS